MGEKPRKSHGQWSVSYGYDTAGNRTSVNDGTIARTMTYTTGNREATVSNNIDPLGYDYKGNVISRMTLDGTKTYHYGWDAFDRLTSATQMWSGGATVGYDYDAMGRLLRRAKASAAGTSTTINYWLGLNKLAEERNFGRMHFILRVLGGDLLPENWSMAVERSTDNVPMHPGRGRSGVPGKWRWPGYRRNNWGSRCC